MTKTYLTLMDRIPPPAAALIAREGRRPLPLKEIALRASLTPQRAVWITSQSSWAPIPCGEAAAFMAACGITPSTIVSHLRYIRRLAEGKAPLSARLKQPGTLRLLAALAKK